jgi:hypothetical protein
MNALAKIADAEPVWSPLDEFRSCAEDYARFYRNGILEKADAVDCAQHHAELWGAVESYGQDAVQAELALAFAGALVPEPDILPVAPLRPREYRTPQVTVDALLFLARTASADELAEWLERHPMDVPTLRKIWEKRKCTAA